MVFTRVKDLRKNTELPAAVKKATEDVISGASVAFYVFDPALENLKAKANRKVLANKKATKTFKNTVREARKELKEG